MVQNWRVELPEGYDVKGSKFFVEPELRPTYELVPAVAPREAVRIVKDFARFEPADASYATQDELQEAQREVIRFALHWHYLMHARAMFRGRVESR